MSLRLSSPCSYTPHLPAASHPSLAATSWPNPWRTYTAWISLVLRQKSQAQTAALSRVSSPYAGSVRPVQSRWNQRWHDASHKMASWSSCTSARQKPQGKTIPGPPSFPGPELGPVEGAAGPGGRGDWVLGVEVELDGGLGLLPGVLPPLLLVMLFWPELGGALGMGPPPPGVLFCWL